MTESYKLFKQQADCIPGWEKMTKTQLANGYCDADEAGDDIKRSQYYSALMCTYWYMVPYMKRQAKGLNLDSDEFVSWLAESLNVAFKYRRWRDPSQEISKKTNAVELIINRSIYSTQQRYYAMFAKQKRAGEYSKLSVDFAVENQMELIESLLVKDDSKDLLEPVTPIIEHFISEDKIFDAFVVDCIINEETVFQRKNDYSFSLACLTRSIKHLDNDYADYFSYRYQVSLDKVKKVIDLIQSYDDKFSVRNKIKKSLAKMKYNKEVKGLLC